MFNQDRAKKAMVIVGMISLSMLLAATGALMAQQPASMSHEVRDALQEQRISTIDTELHQANDRVERLVQELSALKASMDRFTGIGIGLGAAFTMLQAAQIMIALAALRKPKVA